MANKFKYDQRVWIKNHPHYSNVKAVFKGMAGADMAQVLPLVKRPPLGFYIDLLYVPVNDLLLANEGK